MTIEGDVQERVRGVLDTLVGSGRETGSQAAAYRHGVLVADAVAGYADAAGRRPVTPDTLFHSFSTAKGVRATLVHVLVADPGTAAQLVGNEVHAALAHTD
ncbi:serine hydrolase domain-containing protein [Streptomyces buecherae]|uniref:serine hydrolase domain-containing protein n=1 Tax=Streptomyces buecherae TaxID=2763006 RepID=UPI00340C0A06